MSGNQNGKNIITGMPFQRTTTIQNTDYSKWTLIPTINKKINKTYLGNGAFLPLIPGNIKQKYPWILTFLEGGFCFGKMTVAYKILCRFSQNQKKKKKTMNIQIAVPLPLLYSSNLLLIHG